MTVSLEIRTKFSPPVLSEPAFMRELEKKYFDPLEKTIQVGLSECTEQETKGLIPKESIDAKRQELTDL
jgi:hypothetical protein